MSHFTVYRRCRELHGADVLFRTFLYFFENLRLVEARCADMLRALEKVTTLTHFRGVDVATLARKGWSQTKNSSPPVNYDKERRRLRFPSIIYEWWWIFALRPPVSCESGNSDTPKARGGCLLF